MPYCPQCRSEYRQGFEVCGHCDVPLVDALPTLTPVDDTKVRKAIEEDTAVVVARAGLQEASRMSDLLAESGIASTMQGDKDFLDAMGAATVYDLVVHPDDADAARDALREEFRSQILAEGANPDELDKVVDLDGGAEITCPACNTTFTPSGEHVECPECGLFLGAPGA